MGQVIGTNGETERECSYDLLIVASLTRESLSSCASDSSGSISPVDLT